MIVRISKLAIAFFILQSFIALGQTVESKTNIETDEVIRRLESRRSRMYM